MFRSIPARRSLGVTATSLALVSMLSACGLSSGAEKSDDEIVIGVSLPLTGDFSEPGKGVQRGYEAWAKHVNENGGLLGKQVRLEILDDQSSADRVASDYERLINQDEVDLVFGPFSTRLVVPAAQVAKDYGFLFVEPAGAAEEVFTQGFDNLFYAAPAVADDHYNLLAEKILAMPEGRAAQDRGLRDDGRPVRPGHGVRPQGQARGRRRQDRGRRGLPAEHHRLQQHRRQDRRHQGRHRGRRHAVPGRGEPDRVPAAAELPAQDGGLLHGARPTPSSPRRSAPRPRASSRRPATPRTRRTPRTRSSSSSTPTSTAPARPRTRRTPGPPARSSRRPSRPPTAPTRPRSASRS